MPNNGLQEHNVDTEKKKSKGANIPRDDKMSSKVKCPYSQHRIYLEKLILSRLKNYLIYVNRGIESNFRSEVRETL
jgi:hypothetical protein